ncbi:hypothetical protein AB0D12_31685 [Streptomyces sp. NPDC048479]|uniref:hypothetical protein n=1 Tax=Streptomyces sp. NPDC048479 TaxID=3154725 RepID=UPI0034121C39
MGAQLAATVYMKDPDTRQPVKLDPGTLPEPRLAALVTNPAAWVDRKLPRLPKARTDPGPEGGSPSAGGPDGASGDASDTSATADDHLPQPEPAQGDDSQETKPAARKTAARKQAARKPAAD